MNFKESPHLIDLFDFDVLHMQLNTPVFVLVLVLVVMFFMHRWLFRPVLETLHARGDNLRELRRQTEAGREQVARLTAEYEQHLAKAREDVAAVRAEARRDAQQAVGAILERARREAEGELGGALDELRREVEQTAATLHQQAQGLAERVTNRILNA